jgi:hypothetical protein
MFAFLWLLTFYIQTISSKPTNQSAGLGIYHGVTTLWSEAPYMASLRSAAEDSEHCCAATIISLNPPVVATAAHCVVSDTIFGRECGDYVTIGCDEHTCLTGATQPVEYAIAEDGIIIHPDFHHFLVDLRPPLYDIALVRLERPITEPAGVASLPLESGNPCCENMHPLSVYGYGRTRFQFVYGNLTNGTEEYYRNDVCNDLTGTDYFTDDSMICFMDQWNAADELVTVCGGDNGGPVISHRDPSELGTLVGVISWEWSKWIPATDCVATYPQTAANVGYVYDWIIGEIGKM